MLGGKVIELLTPASGMQLDLPRCVRRRFARSQCRACAQACPTGALTIDQDPYIDPNLCTACRRCEAACPTGALRGDERDLSALATSLAQSPRPVLGCRAPQVQAHVHTGCLGFLEIEGLLALSAFFPDGLDLNLTRCQQCPNGGIVPELDTTMERLQSLGEASNGGRLRLVKKPEVLQFQEIDLSRREFFAFLRKRSTETATVAANRLQQAQQSLDGRRKSLPAQRRLLLRALPLLPKDLRRQVESELLPDLQFGPNCTDCTGCAGICPTGAISTSTTDPPKPIFLRHFCTNCRLCAEFCRKGGIVFP